jgi:CxxC motif-containing protein (DUF1111 family)
LLRLLLSSGYLVATALVVPGLAGCDGQVLSGARRPAAPAPPPGPPSTTTPRETPSSAPTAPTAPPGLPPQTGEPPPPRGEPLPDPSGPPGCPGTPPALAPLFPPAGPAQPVVSVDGSGLITTRGAGRVRGRHELEAQFSVYLPLYFENRTYAFSIEDAVAAGGSTVTFTYASLGSPAVAPLTNLRAFKVYGGGNVFHENLDMQPVDGGFRSVVRTNARERRPLRKGDLLEFEFGIFLDGSRVQGRTNYYTDTFRYRVGEGGLTAANADPALGELGPPAEGLAGGDATVPYLAVEPEMAFSQMALSIQPATAESFLKGRRLFHTSFLSGVHSEPDNPPLTEQASKVGPLYNEESCASCHPRNGRGLPPEVGASMKSMVVKVFGPPAAGGEPTAHPTLGRQVANRALGGATRDGDPSIVYQTRERVLPDGTVVQLQKPVLDWRDGVRPERFSLRVARPLVGLGLLEAVPEAAILARADPGDCNADVISGRANFARDPESGAVRLGRFGWKASKVSLRHQVADAALVDIGLTSALFPAAECGPAACPPAAPELAEPDLANLTSYMRALGVPPRRKLTDPRVQRGAALFTALGCASCHVPSVKTGSDHPLVELRNQIIHPYSDLLLHDLGADLADESESEFAALPGEWRTPPLWSIGLTRTVTGETRFLHDGRARSFLEAILWHGGEAAVVRERAANLPTADREALLEFLGSL